MGGLSSPVRGKLALLSRRFFIGDAASAASEAPPMVLGCGAGSTWCWAGSRMSLEGQLPFASPIILIGKGIQEPFAGCP